MPVQNCISKSEVDGANTPARFYVRHLPAVKPTLEGMASCVKNEEDVRSDACAPNRDATLLPHWIKHLVLQIRLAGGTNAAQTWLI